MGYYGDYVLVAAHWIIHTHRILFRKRNTGYAFEGIISAYKVAKMRYHKDALNDLSYTIDHGLYNLGRWQVNGPLSKTNEYLVDHPTQEKNCHRWHNERGKSSAVTNRYHSTSDACRYDGNDDCVQREGTSLIFLGCSCSLSVLIVNGILYLTLDGKIRKKFVRFITTCLFNSYYKT